MVLCFPSLLFASRYGLCTVVSAMGFTHVIFLISTNTLCVSPSLSLLLGANGIFTQYTFIPLRKQLRWVWKGEFSGSQTEGLLRGVRLSVGLIVPLSQLSEKIQLTDKNFSILLLPKIFYVKDFIPAGFLTQFLLLILCVVQILVRKLTFLWGSADSTRIIGRSSKSKKNW